LGRRRGVVEALKTGHSHRNQVSEGRATLGPQDLSRNCNGWDFDEPLQKAGCPPAMQQMPRIWLSGPMRCTASMTLMLWRH
jgi:hypothetical protein